MKNLSFLFLLISSCFFASAAPGILSGKVVDSKNGETLIGVTVLLEGTTQGTVTDIDGNYVIRNVNPGKYNVIFKYVGYTDGVEMDIEIKDGESTVLNKGMSTGEIEIQEVRVEAKASREAASAIVIMQRNMTTITSGISSEEIKRSPDRTSSDVIKRVSGATIVDNKFAIIRGLSDRYNLAMVNGSILPSTEPDRKTFSFDIFPSNLLDNIIINKTAQPDLPGEFAGGIIQLNTREIPEKSFFTINVGQSFYEKSAFKPYYTYQGGKTDFLGVDDGTRAIPAGLPSADSVKRSTVNARLGYGKLFENNWGLQRKKRAYPGQSFQLSGGVLTKLNEDESSKFGMILALTYNNSIRIVESDRYDYEIDNSKIFEYHDTSFNNSVAVGALANFSFQIKNNHRITLKSNYNITSDDRVILRTGTLFQQLRAIQRNTLEFINANLFTSQLTGEHFFEKPGIKWKWYGGFAWVRRFQPNTRRMSYSINLDDPTDTVYTADIPPQVNIGLAGMFFSELDEKIYSGGTDLSIPFTLFKNKQFFKTGFYFQLKDRVFSARVLGNVIARVAQFDYNLLNLPQDQIFDTANFSRAGYNLDEITNNSDKYDAGSKLFAAYAQFENQFGKHFRMVWGGRFEYFNQYLNSINYSNDTINVNEKYPQFLPSVNFIFPINDNSNFRASYSQTVSRPEFREISPFSFYDFATTFTIVGDDSLRQTLIHNADLRYEYFFGRGQAISVSAYYKNFRKPIEMVIDQKTSDYSIFSFKNANFAHNVGVEVEIRKNFDFFNRMAKWDQWENFMLTANFAYIYSRIDLQNLGTSGTLVRSLQGQSPFVVNLGLTYRHPGIDLSASFLYNQSGHRLMIVGNNLFPDIYENSRPVFDFQLSKRVFKKGLVKFTISDLAAKSQIYYQNDGTSKRESYEKDKDSIVFRTRFYRGYSISFSYTF